MSAQAEARVRRALESLSIASTTAAKDRSATVSVSKKHMSWPGAMRARTSCENATFAATPSMNLGMHRRDRSHVVANTGSRKHCA